ncbi:MAG TPA: peptide ABC transporter substrate-binding protein [Anaerolineales bacterium]|nr:peptide ABC transporter substrate-binding protein [Anaerolineales bacterium]HLO30216.1 peptide ABC transporter substrate-binding protein [Anaerolineales bacterium]
MRKNFTILSLLAVFSMILAACGAAPSTATQAPPSGATQAPQATEAPTQAATEAPAPEGAKVLNLNTGGVGDVPTIDPALTTDTTSVQVVEETTVGLSRPNEETSISEPGMASSWDVVNNDDGTQTVTFHLMNNIPWVKYDGEKVVQVMDCQDTPAPRMVTADDFAYGILRTLAPATASDYAYVLAFAIKGAADYNSGTSTDPTTVGVKAVDPTTLEITFNDQAVYNINIAGMWVAHAQPKWLIEGDDCTEARGERWTETGFFEGYGPFTLKEWVHDSTLTMIKNPFWPGTDNVPQPKIDEVNFVMLDESAAFAEYEAGNLDVATVPLSDIDRVKADPTLSQELKIAPDLCTYVYEFNTQAEPVNDVRVRLALSEAVDRQSLIDNVTKGGQEPAQWFARPGIAGAPTIADHPDLGVKFDPTDAKAQLQSYLDEKGLTVDKLNITLMFNTSSGHQKIAEAIQQMWKDNLGLNVQLANQEWKVFLKTIKGADTPQVYRLGWCADYPDANNFDREVYAPGGSDNPNKDGSIGGISWSDDAYNKLLVDAAKETDPKKRVDLYAQAEDILVKKDAVIIPIYWYTRVTCTKPYVTRTFSSAPGNEHFEKWDVAAH